MIDYKKLLNETKFDEEFVLKEISYPNYINEIGELRVVSWKNEPGVNREFFAKSVWIEDYDKIGFHWGVSYKGKFIASCRMSIHNSLPEIPNYNIIKEHQLPKLKFPITSFNRLVVHPDYRFKGVARFLDLIRINAAIEHKTHHIIASPVNFRLEPLQKLGFKLITQLGKFVELPNRPVYLVLLNLEENDN